MDVMFLLAAVLLIVLVVVGVWWVVQGQSLLRLLEPTPRFARRWEREFTKWGVIDENTPVDIRRQLILYWMGISARQGVYLGVASLVGAGIGAPMLLLAKNVLPAVSPSGLYVPALSPYILALIICMGTKPPYDVADEQPPDTTRNVPRMLLGPFVVPALVGALSLVYVFLVTLIGIGVLSPDAYSYPGQLTASSMYWVLWVTPVLMLIVAGLSAYFIVQTLQQRPMRISDDPDVDRLSANKLREYQLFRLQVMPPIFVFLAAQAESQFIPLHGPDLIGSGLFALSLAGSAIYMGGFFYAVSKFGIWTSRGPARDNLGRTSDSAH